MPRIERLRHWGCENNAGLQIASQTRHSYRRARGGAARDAEICLSAMPGSIGGKSPSNDRTYAL